MPHKRSKKKPRGSRGFRHAPCVLDSQQQLSSSRPHHEMMIPLPKEGGQAEKVLRMKEIMDRLESVGYSSVTLTHTIYGTPRKPDDDAESVFSPFGTTGSKKRKNTLRIYKRLHAVVENVSDVGFYAAEQRFGYDLVSIAPRNDATFWAACATATSAVIITLDYTAAGGMPFRVRPANVKAAVARRAVFELFYAPAILRISQRKGLVQAATTLRNASTGEKPRLILSAGSNDIMALRSPGDLINVMQTVLRFDPTLSHDALSTSATEALENARQRKSAPSNYHNKVVAIHLEDDNDKKESTETTKQEPRNDKNNHETQDGNDKNEEPNEDGDLAEEGFIRFS